MKRAKQLAGGVLLFLSGMIFLFVSFIAWHSPGKTEPILDTDGNPIPGSIARLEPISVNGSTQWLLIRGQDSTKPVLLFLHGGPGLPELPLLVGHPLEKEFVVVNWEQRGSGKSYNSADFNDTFTVDQFVADAAEVSRQLARRFRQPGTDSAKLYLMAHSWGTFLGILTVKKHPDLYHAFFSISQIARQLEAEQISYDWVLQQARQAGAGGQVRKLEKQGRPPYPPDAWFDYLTWQRGLVADYHGGMYKGDFYPLFIRSILFCKEYTLLDKIRYGFGAMKTVRRLWPAVVATDLFREVPALEVPYYLFQGTHDYQTPYSIARAYFNRVHAPKKRMFTFLNSAHSPIFEEPKRFMHCLDSVLTTEPLKGR